MIDQEETHQEETHQEDEKPIIKHLVLSGGIIYGYAFYGAYKFLEQKGYVNIDNIQTMYGTSVGAIVSIVLSLRYEWETLDNYFIKRPWHEVFKFTIETFMNCYQKCGLFGPELFEAIFEPLFRAKDLDISTITMKEFYETTKIEHHFFTVDIGVFELIDISYKTHPDCRVLDAVYASSCVPFLFQPIKMSMGNQDSSGTRLIDGGFLMNYPLQPCIQRVSDISGDDIAILGINLVFDEHISQKLENIHFNVFEYVYLIMGIVLYKIHKLMSNAYISSNTNSSVKLYEIQIPPNEHPSSELLKFVHSPEERMKMIEYGEQQAIEQWAL
jgi:predicted acylesterase/phospholipase RssA